MKQRLTIHQINGLGHGAFVQALAPVFEGTPWIAARTWDARPFESIAALHGALCDAMYAAPRRQQVALIRAHPDLVGRAAMLGTLTPESLDEQASAGLDRLSPEEVARFSELNAKYREQFGFPFVICVRENKKEAILAGFTSRLSNSREDEIRTVLGEIARIAWLRLVDLVDEAGETGQ